jgi:alginate O-acetyltransferase complex protein AlgI
MAKNNFYAGAPYITYKTKKIVEQLNFFSLFVATIIAISIILLLKRKSYYWVALLLASLSFYWLVAHNKLFLIVAYSFIIYLCSLVAAERTKSKSFFLLLVAASLLPLIGVKIIFSLSLVSSFSFLQTPIEYSGSNQFITIIPGLSFITFNGLSYLIDIRRGYINPEKNFLLVLLYLTFFPYVLSGPLHRAKSFFIQVKTKIEFNSSNLSLAFRCLLLGFFKSFVLAERFYSAWLDLQLANTTGFFVLLQGLLFFLYLYCVFSSFIDISRGIAWLFNFPLETNFKNGVYASSSRRLFWQGWHITLNNWFRDYVFYPLMKKPFFRTSANGALFICFLLIGLWHGVSWQFLLWGALNGIWVIMEIKFQKHFLFIPINQRKWLGVIYHLC